MCLLPPHTQVEEVIRTDRLSGCYDSGNPSESFYTSLNYIINPEDQAHHLHMIFVKKDTIPIPYCAGREDGAGPITMKVESADQEKGNRYNYEKGFVVCNGHYRIHAFRLN